MSQKESWDRLYKRDDRPWKGDPDATLPFEGTVLELGVGNGKGLAALSTNTQPIGLDFSRQALWSCRRWRSLPLLQGDVTALPIRDACMPSIATSHVLGHLLLPDRIDAAMEITRVLANDGRLFISVFGDGDMRCGKGTEVEQRTYERGNGIICHYFAEGEVIELFPDLQLEEEWTRCVSKRYHGRDEVRQERRALLRK
ncbi:MAG: methyltransferase domain-containing protein [Methanomassiliicoccales archaeon]|nr:methyltransferase domain-containing protein [Methanomassiliicoccales archaeon]